MRTARSLLSARVAPLRVRKALRRLREQLPEGRSLAAVRIAMEGSRIVVADGSRRWQPDSGQILFDFGVADLAKKVAPVVRRAFREAQEEGPGVFGRRLVRVGLRARARLSGRGHLGLPARPRARSPASGRARQPRPAPPRGRRRRGGRAALRGRPRRAARRRDGGVQPRRGARRPGKDARGPARLPEGGADPTRQRRRPLQRRDAGREARPPRRGAPPPPDLPEAHAGIRDRRREAREQALDLRLARSEPGARSPQVVGEHRIPVAARGIAEPDDVEGRDDLADPATQVAPSAPESASAQHSRKPGAKRGMSPERNAPESSGRPRRRAASA